MNTEWADRMAAKFRTLRLTPPTGHTLRPHVDTVVRRSTRSAGGGRVSVQASGDQVRVEGSGPAGRRALAQVRRERDAIARAVRDDVQGQVERA